MHHHLEGSRLPCMFSRFATDFGLKRGKKIEISSLLTFLLIILPSLRLGRLRELLNIAKSIAYHDMKLSLETATERCESIHVCCVLKASEENF